MKAVNTKYPPPMVYNLQMACWLIYVYCVKLPKYL